ncbi:putative chromate ion transporter [Bimuria novae-zelandiae CBS 107.79]|uniref:Putative chromate ion transporter n=1 Tax=Bimuria novae-zelandiae CBS 107.79 TaxID=1447943 RepID=A0A6A5UWS9_9PLEO|nr:putative chromate ion transporter [Bimuria novae-zelandiae CBS 107.79]
MRLPSTVSHQIASLRALAKRARDPASARDEQKTLPGRLMDVFVHTWDLGFTAFGGPPVHFQILHQRFVEKYEWVDEQTYQELFAICQALPGPASTKMVFCLALIHAGFVPAVLTFALWSLPGAIGMYALALGVQRMSDILSASVYALLSGLNASTVGIIALAAVQLAEKSIRDKLTRILVILGACAGMCYTALWYFPLLIALGGIATVVWDGWLGRNVGALRRRLQRRRQHDVRSGDEEVESVPIEAIGVQPGSAVQRKTPAATAPKEEQRQSPVQSALEDQPERIDAPPTYSIRIRVGIAIVVLFFASFVTVLVTRGVLKAPPLALNLFANMYLAGTIIFGGGPVVIPLLRAYVVDPGWVSSRDFLLGLAIIQAFPGPNFNFAVYLGALTMQKSQFPTVFGAVLGFVGIFLPGLALAVAVQSFWRALRRKKWVVDLLRGVNATAVGLVFTAVYRLWEIGYLTPEAGRGQSLALEPWWVVVAAITYAESAWFGIPPAIAIVLGAVLGLCWYGAVGQ